MKKSPLEHSLSKYENSVFESEDLIAIYYTKNGCGYRWGIPFKNFGAFEQLKKPYQIDDLLSLGAKLFDILVVGQHSIDFKQNTGVQKLEVVVRSAESEDRQLLHRITSEFRAKDTEVDKDNIPGTNNDNE